MEAPKYNYEIYISKNLKFLHLYTILNLKLYRMWRHRRVLLRISTSIIQNRVVEVGQPIAKMRNEKLIKNRYYMLFAHLKIYKRIKILKREKLDRTTLADERVKKFVGENETLTVEIRRVGRSGRKQSARRLRTRVRQRRSVRAKSIFRAGYRFGYF